MATNVNGVLICIVAKANRHDMKVAFGAKRCESPQWSIPSRSYGRWW
jgi:hypothetical protein